MFETSLTLFLFYVIPPVETELATAELPGPVETELATAVPLLTAASAVPFLTSRTLLASDLKASIRSLREDV